MRLDHGDVVAQLSLAEQDLSRMRALSRHIRRSATEVTAPVVAGAAAEDVNPLLLPPPVTGTTWSPLWGNMRLGVKSALSASSCAHTLWATCSQEDMEVRSACSRMRHGHLSYTASRSVLWHLYARCRSALACAIHCRLSVCWYGASSASCARLAVNLHATAVETSKCFQTGLRHRVQLRRPCGVCCRHQSRRLLGDLHLG